MHGVSLNVQGHAVCGKTGLLAQTCSRCDSALSVASQVGTSKCIIGSSDRVLSGGKRSQAGEPMVSSSSVQEAHKLVLLEHLELPAAMPNGLHCKNFTCRAWLNPGLPPDWLLKRERLVLGAASDKGTKGSVLWRSLCAGMANN